MGALLKKRPHTPPKLFWGDDFEEDSFPYASDFWSAHHF